MDDEQEKPTVFSPSGKFITFMGRQHKKYIKLEEMECPESYKIVEQKGNKKNRVAVYKKRNVPKREETPLQIIQEKKHSFIF